MGYDATEVTDLFKFRLKPGDEWRWVPSPTDPEVNKFSDAYRAAQAAAVGLTVADVEADVDGAQEKLNAINVAQRRRLGEEILEAVIEFCKGTPTAEELTALPALERLGFTQWLIGVLNPLL